MWRQTFVNYKYPQTLPFLLWGFQKSLVSDYVCETFCPLYFFLERAHLSSSACSSFSADGSLEPASLRLHSQLLSCLLFGLRCGKTEIITALPYLGAWPLGAHGPLQGYPQTQMCSGESEYYKLGHVLSLTPAL